MTILPHSTAGHGSHHVLAFHGWFGDRTSYDPLLRYVDPEHFTWAAVDQRGYGDAQGTTGAYTTEEVARDGLALADQLGWDSFSVVGHSMGGKVAQHLLALAPGRVRAVVGISPVPAAGAGFDEATAGFFAAAVDDPSVRRAIIDNTTGQRLSGVWLDEMVDRSLANSTKQAFAGYLPDWASTDFHTQVQGDKTPVLAVTGAHDPALSAEVMRGTLLQWFPNARLVDLAEAGHYALDETPLALLAEIEKFLRANGNPG
ncbi:pimeloyl-ACP methyl ester carboxylesterase [Crossiella equi]|uniref:Pimeloyl-ACP methyl ester carboxylesterase n=1 Tax=Crossiella equi TaxID=130796 RepID=A0ABS5AHE5_9PSEU|nr:alpha/beta hydrolase [Crossiella equi]MBP2475644.1 pimeloyl-ACP methyl ester carboxylesterase [Crossiella equi]